MRPLDITRRGLLHAGIGLSGAAVASRVLAQHPQGALERDRPVVRVTLEQAAAELASGGWVMMMRHEQTEPGIGDPPNFRLGDCSTQRNLSATGRARARRVGEAMRAAGIRLTVVRAGRWCRVQETAELAFGAVEPWPALDSFFGQSEQAQSHRDPVLAFARGFEGPGNAMLVTHQVNITATLDVYPEMGEIIAARNRGGRVIAQLRFTPGTP